MPSQHRYRAAVYRPDPDLHERAKTASADVGSDMNAHILGFLRWLVGDTDELPPRPEKPAPAATGSQRQSRTGRTP